MIPESDPFAPVLHQFLNVNYETEKRRPDNPKHPNPHHPLVFFDRHIATTLQLKSIERAPWIAKELGRICEDAIKKFTAEGHSFIESDGYWAIEQGYPVSRTDSDDVAQYHFARVARRCNLYTSKLLFHPDDPAWFSFLASRMQLSVSPEYSFNRFGDTAIIKPEETDSGEREYEIPTETRRTLADWVIPAIDKLGTNRSIFSYEFYIKDKKAEDLLVKMGPCARFKWETPTVTGAPALPEPSSRPLDSPLIKSFFPPLSIVTSRKPAMQKKPKPRNVADRKRRLLAPLQRTQGRERQYRINSNHYIQKAWARAVETNATFIIFSCGRSERIGIRHRESQTLYLSDLIDPARLKQPGYGQMHLGLCLAATEDRFDRLKEEAKSNLKRKPEKSTTTPARHHGNNMKDKATRRKRRKLDPELEDGFLELDKKVFDDELAKRDLVLLYLDFGVRQSPAPSSFRRMESSCASLPFTYKSYNFKRKPAYPPESYISVTANNNYIGDGAVGLTYRVKVEIEMDSGVKCRRNLILKLAIGLKKEQIIQEYDLYKRLAEAGVTHGIIGVHGLFHDMETGAMLMIMDDAGMSLRTRAIEQGLTIENNDSVDTSEEECDAFVEVLKGIHSAYILHRDLRIDNLMINEDGEVFIIDFDCGKYNIDAVPYAYDEDLAELMSTIGWKAVFEYEDEQRGENEGKEDGSEEEGGNEEEGENEEGDAGDGSRDGDEGHE